MSRLIDADALWLVTEGDHQYYEKFEIDDAPTIEAEPIRHEHWDEVLEQPYFRKQYCCSACQRKGYKTWNYCPECGAKMDEEEEDDGI